MRTMRMWLGRTLVRLGLRALGFAPRNAVVVAHETWDAPAAARWGVEAAFTVPGTPPDVCLMFVRDGRPAFNAAVAARTPKPPTGDRRSNGGHTDDPH